MAPCLAQNLAEESSVLEPWHRGQHLRHLFYVSSDLSRVGALGDQADQSDEHTRCKGDVQVGVQVREVEGLSILLASEAHAYQGFSGFTGLDESLSPPLWHLCHVGLVPHPVKYTRVCEQVSTAASGDH